MIEIARNAVKILLVEDNLADVRLMEELLQSCKFPVRLKVAWDGEEGLRALSQSPFEGKEDPDMILLDLNLPKVNGHEILEKIKKDSNLKQIPVLIFTGSENRKDLALALQNQADGFLFKAHDIEGLPPMLKTIEDFWFKFKTKMA
jgi:CheY-like chemotaxis protein